MPLHLDPARVHPAPGKVLVHLHEVLGGTTPGGIFVPADLADQGGKKDTASGRVLAIGPSPSFRHETPRLGASYQRLGRIVPSRSGTPWPSAAFPVQPGDTIFFPRDVPLVFTWDETRYALVAMEEVIVAAAPGDRVEIPARTA